MKAYGEVDVYNHFFLTSALTGGEWSASLPDRFTPGKSPRYPLDRSLGGPQSQSGQHGEEKILDPTGTRTPTSVVQPVLGLYTEYAIPAPTALS
jgi:hypothetical protein